MQSMKRMEELIHLNKKIHFEGKVDENITHYEHGEHSFSVHLLYVHVQYVPLSSIHCGIGFGEQRILFLIAIVWVNPIMFAHCISQVKKLLCL